MDLRKWMLQIGQIVTVAITNRPNYRKTEYRILLHLKGQLFDITVAYCFLYHTNISYV